MKAAHLSNTKYLNKVEAQRAIMKIAEEQGWKWWVDNENRIIIDVDGSLENHDESTD